MKTLTFADTLNPQYGNEHINPQNDSSTVWGTVLNEARGDMPKIVAVAEEVDVRHPEDTPFTTPPSGEGMTSAPERESASQTSGVESRRRMGRGCCFLEGVLGCSLALAAVASVLGIELCASVVYCLASMFHWIANVNAGDMNVIFQVIFLLIAQVLMLTDAILLTASVLVTESIGWIACLVTSMFSLDCCRTGSAWHLYIRKICHLARWAFRNFHEGWTLQRTYPVGIVQKDDEDKNDSADHQTGPSSSRSYCHSSAPTGK